MATRKGETKTTKKATAAKRRGPRMRDPRTYGQLLAILKRTRLPRGSLVAQAREAAIRANAEAHDLGRRVSIMEGFLSYCADYTVEYVEEWLLMMSVLEDEGALRALAKDALERADRIRDKAAG